MNGFLLDENLPYRLRFQTTKPVFHASDLGRARPDAELWDYAQRHSLAIVSKDADFSERILLSNPPPWVVHLRMGNLRSVEFHAFLERIWPRLESLLTSSKLLNVYMDRIESAS